MARALAGIVLLSLLYLLFEQFASGGAAAAWQPPGYHTVNAGVAYRWAPGSCASGAQDGCWHTLVVSREPCSAELTLTLRESRGGIVVGEIAQDATSVEALTPVELEFDATASGPLSGTIANAACL